jgi:hypothetical protein
MQSKGERMWESTMPSRRKHRAVDKPAKMTTSGMITITTTRTLTGIMTRYYVDAVDLIEVMTGMKVLVARGLEFQGIDMASCALAVEQIISLTCN